MKLNFVMNILLLLLFLSNSTGVAGAVQSEIIQITESTRYLVPEGKEVSAIDGDWIMRNDKVIAVIGNAASDREANMRVQSIQGAVIAFTSLAVNNNSLTAYYPQGYPHEDSRVDPSEGAHLIEIVSREGPAVSLRAIRNPTERYPYEAVTEYTLKEGEEFLRVKTTYFNPNEQDITIKFSDRLRLDNDISDASPPGNHKLAFIYNKWFHSAYGIYSAETLRVPDSPDISGGPGGGMPVAYNESGDDDTILLKAGEKADISRYLFYGKDVAEIQRKTVGIENSESRMTTLNITDPDESPVSDVHLEIYNNRNELVSFAITDDSGQTEIPLPAGTYHLEAVKTGHDTLATDFSVHSDMAAQSTSLSLAMNRLTSIEFNITDSDNNRSLPVKLEFKGVNGTPDPYLGPVKRASGARNLYYALNEGTFKVPISPGHYLITISHGPEYDTVQKEVEIRRDGNNTVTAELKRAFSTEDWVIADLHNHTTVSGDNDADVKSRVINMAGAGIEFAPATEHNLIRSYSGEIEELGLEEYIASAAGIELTGYPGSGSIGPNHQNAFPLTIQEGKQGGGFSDIGMDADPFIQIKRLIEYNDHEFKLIQHNHPNIPWLYFDKNRDGIMDDGFNTREMTDVLEIQDEMYKVLDVTSGNENKNSRVFHWLQMLNQGDRIYGTTTSDSHSVGARTGERFIYAYTRLDQPMDMDAVDIAKNVKKGRVIMSNGPFIRVDVNGHLPGDEIKYDLQNNDVGIVDIEVYANNEVDINRIQLLVNGVQHSNMNFTISSHPELFKGSSLQFRHSLSIDLEEDAHIIVIATGDRISAAAELTEEVQNTIPIAISNPIYVDVNEDGFKANKDTLGEPLPVYKRE